MESLLRGELSFRGAREVLREDGCGLGWPTSPLPVDISPASQFALTAAYHDIKQRLAGLERENSSIKKKLKNYEITFPMISVFEEERSMCRTCDPTEATLMHVEDSLNLQQRISNLTQELQKSKAQKEHLEEVIKAYENIHLEKTSVQKDLDNMATLAEQHLKRIRGLETALRQRDLLLQRRCSRLGSARESSYSRSREAYCLHLHNSLDVPCDCPGPTLHSSRSLDTLTDLRVLRLEAELEGARHEAQGAFQREEELKSELQRLQEEVQHLQDQQRQELDAPCEHCSVEWIKKAGDEQVNLALAYTELTEELRRICILTAEQSEILRQARNPPEQKSPVLRRSPAPHHSSVASPLPLTTLSPLTPSISHSACPSVHHLRANFQGRRSYSEMASSSAHQGSAQIICNPVSTLPKPRPGGNGYLGQQEQSQASSVGTRPASAHGRSLSRGDMTSSPRLELGFPLPGVQLLCSYDELPAPAPLVTPPQSSEDEEEEWPCPSPTHSPPRTLGVMPPHPPFPAPDGPCTLTCPLLGYLSTEHARSWPSIKLWMESEENDSRNCPLCQLTFPTGYPDDALIKHIDTHLENSKI
ncbi:TANK-binding kinase 1-binding protein 1-like [Electrophorus electricus]|uniref:TANK-binding kinase 1-binding protein 1-like n=1 Tax=Electrophorus electricus TaxID=8005 RepID=UPI0015D067E2|nr:TANK-binding kinase 1-binding protein 1-like [Electrophorus electricus]